MKNIKTLKEEKKYFLVILLLMPIYAIRYFPFKFGGFNQIMLSFTYSYGFIQRAFIGTILDIESTLLHIPLKYMRYIYGISTVIIWTLLLLYILRKTIVKSSGDKLIFLKSLGLAFFLGPGWVAFYSNFAITDVWLIMCAVFSVYLIEKRKYAYLSIIVTLIAQLIHPGYFFLIFNLPAAYLFYKIFISEQTDKKQKKEILGVLIGNIVFSAGLFFYLFLFAKVKDGITVDYIMSRTAEFVSKDISEIANHEKLIKGFLFRKGTITGIQICFDTYYLLFISMLIVFSPFFIEIGRYWHIVVQKAKQINRCKAFLYGLLPFGAITLIPVYVMQNDYGRWTYAGFFYEFAIIWILNMIHDEIIESTTIDYMKHVKQNKYYYIFLLCYAAICGTFQQNLINDLIATLETYMWKIVDFL